jgi:hypothetical protein
MIVRYSNQEFFNLNKMKIQIDTKARVIRIDETVKFDELIKVLNKLLPKEWKEYSLETGSIIYWSNPIVWHYPNPWVYPIYPITYGTSSCGIQCSGDSNSLVYNIECLTN